jgi:DNA-binding CsgD family transcriptional regulator
LIHLPENLDTATMSLRDKVLVSSPVALMVVMCSASSGLAAGSPEGILLDTNFWSLISVLPIGLLFLWSLVWFWKRFMDIDTLLISSAVPLAIALLLFIVSYQFQSGYRVSLGFLIQLMFLMLGWACALLLGRINSRTEIIAPYYVIMLIALFGLFILISQLLDPSVFSEVFAFLALAFLVYLLVLFFIKSRPPSNRLSDEPEMSMQQDELDLVLLRKCRLITDCYGLSARESEVLPLIIMGDSSTVIAKRLFISPATVKTYRYRIFCKMNVHNHEELLVCVRAIEDTRAEPR